MELRSNQRPKFFAAPKQSQVPISPVKSPYRQLAFAPISQLTKTPFLGHWPLKRRLARIRHSRWDSSPLLSERNGRVFCTKALEHGIVSPLVRGGIQAQNVYVIALG